MAKFRQNHQKNSRRGGNRFFTRLLVLTLFFLGLTVFVIILLSRKIRFNQPATPGTSYEIPVAKDTADRFYLPSLSKGQLVHHTYYSLSYDERYELAEWVAYELTKESLQIRNVDRTDWYLDDPLVTTESATYHDYTSSGYTRGHLAPAGDMAFDTTAMKESFYMSNIGPQKRAFNQGIWRELEEQVRNWAYLNERVYVVTGPVRSTISKTIGKNHVGVPEWYYKVILDINDPGRKGIGFLIPNEISEIHLREFAVTIDSVERRVDIDFYKNLVDIEWEQKLESHIDIDLWSFDKELFMKRIQVWNRD